MLAIVKTTDALEAQIDFDSFWLLYPRKVCKKDARKAWDRVAPADRPKAIEAVAAWRRIWANKEIEYVPHAASWLNGERWEDELPKGITSTSASHVAFAPPEKPQPKSELPEHVKALIAKLKAQ